MYCPTCATEIVDDQRYCRSCGYDLKPATPARRNFGRSIALGILVLMIGVITNVINKNLVHNDVLATIATIVSILGAFWMMLSAVGFAPAAARFDKRLLSRTKTEPQREREPSLKAHASTNRLPAGDTFEPVPSVVEHTTELLKKPQSRSGL